MKKGLLFTALCTSVFFLTQCRTARNTTTTAAPNVTYTANIQPLMAANCSPCHFPDKGGKVEALNSYAPVKGHIDEILSRIALHPGDKGFMPMKRARLSDSTINVFREWKAQGLAE